MEEMSRVRFDELSRMARHVARRLAGREHHDDLVAVAVTEVWRTDSPYPWWTMRSAMIDHLRAWTTQGTHRHRIPALVPLEDVDVATYDHYEVESCRSALVEHFGPRTADALTCQADDIKIETVALRYGVSPARLSQLRRNAQRRLLASPHLRERVGLSA